jgi:hypothetical protein
MKNNLRETLFGFRTRRSNAAQPGTKRPPAAFNEAGTTLFKRRSPRTIGVTEQRLRARNQRSWVKGAHAWKKFVRIFLAPAS